MNRIYAMTCFYNPARFPNRAALYRQFRAQFRKDVRLLVVECVSGHAPFELREDDADIIVRVRGDVMWQKERLLNVALEYLPEECSIVAWFDCDVVLESTDWPEAATAALQDHDVVQLFSRVSWRGPRDAGSPPDDLGPEIATWTGVMFEHCTGQLDSEFYDEWSKPGRSDEPIADGYAWAARRDILDGCGFYDGCIIGAGTRPFALLAMGKSDVLKNTPWMNDYQRKHVQLWADAATRKISMRGTYLPGVVDHLWHGAVASRQYATREWRLKESGFNPAADIVINDVGAWIWASGRTGIAELVADFFAARGENTALPSPGDRRSAQ